MEEFGGHPHITVIPENTGHPEVYSVIYRIPGLRLYQGKPIECNHHRVIIQLGRDYPLMKPKCEIITPVFHPNMEGGIICIGSQWSAGAEGLVDLIVRVGDMLQYKVYNLRSVMNQRAADWVAGHPHCLPVGHIELYRADGKGGKTDDWSLEFLDDGRGRKEDFELTFLD
jgi:ubiquitin-protein ligase